MIYLGGVEDKMKMNKKGLIGGLVMLILVVLGGYFLLTYLGVF